LNKLKQIDLTSNCVSFQVWYTWYARNITSNFE
jgi:hypothetical protein